VFTGLVADVGKVESAERGDEGARLRIATTLASDVAPGDSVAVNGVCLTAASVMDGGFEADVMNQTLSVTSLGPLAAGDPVNLELALRASDRLGGHIVQGHVDGTAEIAEVREDGFAKRVRLAVGPDLARYVVEHGSVTLDGVSLTVAALTDYGFEVSLIPETLERTNLGSAAPGRVVNVEVDVVSRYVERLLSTKESQ
jgi:riboflavin synthase